MYVAAIHYIRHWFLKKKKKVVVESEIPQNFACLLLSIKRFAFQYGSLIAPFFKKLGLDYYIIKILIAIPPTF